MNKFACFLILTAGILWGAMGVFVDALTDLGFSAVQASALRICSSAVMYVVFLAIKDKKLLKIKVKDIGFFLVMGIVTVLSMSSLYFLAIKNTSYAVAAILLYTAPIIVSVLSAFIFKEKFGKSKLLALIIAFAGCVLVSGVSTGVDIKFIGIVFGLLSGLSYALYSIFGKFALKKYSPFTVTTYAFLFGALGTLFVSDVPGMAAIVAGVTDITGLIFKILLTGLITAFLPFVLYTMGLQKLDAGQASILASVEPLAATVCGVLRGQSLSVGAALGIACILCAVVIVSTGAKESKSEVISS